MKVFNHVIKHVVVPTAFLLSAVGANAQTPPPPAESVVTGWNYVEMLSCWVHQLAPVAPATTGLDELVVGVTVVPAPPATIPSGPKSQDGEISTTDPVVIGLAGPFCSSGNPFWAYWDGHTWTMAAVYPNSNN